MSTHRVSNPRIAAYATPALLTGIILYPLTAILPTVYADIAGLNLALIGTILFIGRVFDAVTDPIIGHLSDITKSRIGARKPWILAGLGLGMVAIYFLFTPSPSVTIFYFTFWFLCAFLAFTMIDIPHRAWGTEISRHYDTRSKISTYLGVFVNIGMLTFALVPLLPVFAKTGYTVEVLRAMGIGAVVLIPLIACAAVIFGPSGETITTERPTIISTIGAIKGNKPFFYFLMVYIISGLGYGMFYALSFLYADKYLQLGHRYPWFIGADAIATLLIIPVWLKIMMKVGKHRAMAIGTVLGSVFLIAIAFIKPGESSFLPFLILNVARSMAVACLHVVPMAILGDVVDYDLFKTGISRTANYFSAFALFAKINVGIAAALAYIILGAMGYRVGEANTESAVFGLIIVALVLPAILLMGGGGIMWWFPINRRRQSIIRRCIEKRAERMAKPTIEGETDTLQP